MRDREAEGAYLGEEKLASTKHVTDNVHAVHEWLLDDHEGLRHLR